jgi:hypothetical protein
MTMTPSFPRQAGQEAVIANLVAAFSSETGFERARARRSLSRIGPAAVPRLIDCLSSEEGIVRWEAAKTLKEIGDPGAADALVTALADPAQGVRWLAAEALINLQKDAFEPVLRGMVRHLDSIWFRESAHHVLSAWSHAHMLTPEINDVLSAFRDLSLSQEFISLLAHRALIMLTERKTTQQLTGELDPAHSDFRE